MGYYDQSLLSTDVDFINRCAACVAVEGVPNNGDPQMWAGSHSWQLAAAPGFADAYSSAIAGGVPNPGRDPAVISDAQILGAVQAELTP